MAHIQQKIFFTCSDGVTLSYQYWLPKSVNNYQDTPTIVIFYHYTEQPENVAQFIQSLNLSAYRFFVWKVKDNVTSEPDTSSIATLIYRTHQFIEHIKSEYDINEQDIAVIAQDIEAVIVSTWIHDYAPNIKAQILISPALQPKQFSIVMPLLQAASFKNISLIKWPDSISFLTDLFSTTQRIIKDAAAIYIPTLIISSGKEYVTGQKWLQQFYDNLSSVKKELSILPTIYDDSIKEKNNHIIVTKLSFFLKECFAIKDHLPLLRDADKQGYTKEEFEQLLKPEVNFFKTVYWTVNRLIIRYIGKYITGVRVGLDTGFDSGLSLDYAYKNQAQGKNPFSRYFDRYYLNNIGWRAVRLRKKHVEELMLLATERLAEQYKRINVLDIAAGHGRYILDVFRKTPQQISHILMRDYDEKNVQQGQMMILHKGLNETINFEQGDAFSLTDLSTLPKDRTLAVVSGFYELFSDNSKVSTSLAGLAKAMEDGGYLIYTGIIWHPEQEYMARVLNNHCGDGWVLRRRTQLELDQLVTAAGFEKVTQRIDPWGIHSVSLARKATSTLDTDK